ncbi:hypothetical protein GIB67_011407 [Kingdonia uniflora]|uniref:Secreted protein n=1 Tax=Kingdonia uniflora TaxID=39325 RepID=A0A7J7NM44_9MAGN|nr:hypothetical protein GIB67_011407 [Kingdonia uniflora]
MPTFLLYWVVLTRFILLRLSSRLSVGFIPQFKLKNSGKVRKQRRKIHRFIYLLDRVKVDPGFLGQLGLHRWINR